MDKARKEDVTTSETTLYTSDLDTTCLEAALPTLTAKLMQLQHGLTQEEQSLFSDIINSAAEHLATLRPNDLEGTNLSYAKPISSHATPDVRAHLLELPQKLNLKS
jgi:hypothetical protein